MTTPITGHIPTSTLLTLGTESIPPLIDGLLWEGDHVMLVAKEKAGKSILSWQLALSLTSGTDFLGEYAIPHPRNVAYICAEGHPRSIGRNLERMSRVVPLCPERFGFFYYNALPLDQPDSLKRVVHDIETWNHPHVIILDPLYLLMEGDLIDNQHARRMVAHLRTLANHFNAALILNHHEHRPQFDAKNGHMIPESDNSIFGSFVWKAYPDNVLVLMKDANKSRTLICKTQRLDKLPEVLPLTLQGSASANDALYFELRTDSRVHQDALLAFIPSGKDTIDTPALIAATGWPRPSVWSMLNRLQDRRHISCTNPGKKPSCWRRT